MTIAVAVDNIYNPGSGRATMTTYVFRVWLHPNPPLGFEPEEEEVWRDIEIDGSHTLADFHEAIFAAFDRWDSHAYEFITRDEDGIALRSYVHPGLYDGGLSWQPMDDEEIDRFIDRAVPEDASEAAKNRFRDLQSSSLNSSDCLSWASVSASTSAAYASRIALASARPSTVGSHRAVVP